MFELSSPEITAAANGAWMVLALFVAIACHGILRWRWFRNQYRINEALSPITVDVLTWVRLTAIATFAHRCYWNIGITLRLDGAYAPATVESKHITIVFVAMMVVGTYKTMAALCPPDDRRWLLVSLASVVAASSAVWGFLA